MRFTATGRRSIVATSVKRGRDDAALPEDTLRSIAVDVPDATKEKVDEHVEGRFEAPEVGRMRHEGRACGRAHVLLAPHVDLSDGCEECACPSRVDRQLGAAEQSR